MKALFLIALVFAGFILFMGISTRKINGDPLSNALIIGALIIASAVGIIWTITFIKEKKDGSGE